MSMSVKNQKNIRGRFAPSPTGRMHLGNVYSALISWLSAKGKGGEWLLRIEDIDPDRSHKSYAEQIMEDLQWLGLEWDGVPVFQSDRNDIYQHYYDVLKQKRLTYPCYCSRNDILATQAPHESDGRVVYKGTCRNKPLRPDVPAATRMKVPSKTVSFVDGHYGQQQVDLEKQVGDFIIRRKDGAWAYQLAVVVDDALMGINEVVRGRDLLLSSPQQIYLFEQLGFAAPDYYHIPLLCNDSHLRLSKRDQSLDMGHLRKTYSSQEIIGCIAYYAGLISAFIPISPNDLLHDFSWDKIPTEDIVVQNY